ncbi:interferon-induced, double-stranded RNA-activated protein kinase isoform X1 [Oncorhynchus tshawytscha]|uniref:interferon-induced, double-stranded RNA-activated protein kinase isoform X1 n=1 Tax=Oncorhynchus tshawytscha TaxID=74940 RepID=UPI001C3D8CA4|nr:interferon-induced, double-stranded RNA-activated protein kinase isoform X1 [Oncorhynchus tshawytscha]
MDSTNYISILCEYAQRQRQISDIKFEEVGTEGPDHLKTFTLRVVIKGHAYPNGVGKNKKEAKQNAAKHALAGMMETTEQKDEHALAGVAETTEQKDASVSCPPSPAQSPAPPVRAVISQPNYVCWLNEHSQKNKLSLKALEETRVGPNNTSQCCRYVVGEKEYPEGFGNTKKEAKEEAAMQVYLELCGRSQTTGTADENCNGTTGKHKEELNPKVVVLSEKVEHMNMSPEQNVPARYSFITTEETNFIGILNHYCQKTKRFPDFKLVEKSGPSHDPQFVYKVLIDQREYPNGLGKTAKQAKQQAAQLAWSALQEQSDWNSQVSCRSTVSEDGGLSSLTPSSTWESQDATPSSLSIPGSTSESIIFADSVNVSSPKQVESPVNVKPKIRLAPNFLMSPVKTKQEGPDLKGNNLGTLSSGRTSNQPIKSRFLSEFDSIEKIGKGGFGNVYKARRELEQKYFAVKIVLSKGKAKREVGALADLQHPNIVRYYTAWLEDTAYRCDTNSESDTTSDSGSSSSSEFLYIQMELCDKRTLKVWIDERNAHRKPKRREESLHITQQIVNGVEYIHSKKLLHRDLKPANIMFGMSDGEGKGEVKIGDFGLVTAEDNDNDENLLERTKKTGTKSYMAPEQRNQTSYDRKVDIFALGLIYFELLWNLSGMEKAEVWNDVRSQSFPPQFNTQFNLENKVIESMLCANPEDRPDARQLKIKLIECSCVLTRDQNFHQDNRTV